MEEEERQSFRTVASESPGVPGLFGRFLEDSMGNSGDSPGKY